MSYTHKEHKPKNFSLDKEFIDKLPKHNNVDGIKNEYTLSGVDCITRDNIKECEALSDMQVRDFYMRNKK